MWNVKKKRKTMNYDAKVEKEKLDVGNNKERT